MTVLVQFAIGLLFGLGLIISGMSNPAKVLNFLDLGSIPAGTWDASLAFVMAGAVAVTFVGFRHVLKLAHPLFADRFHEPTRSDSDPKIIVAAKEDLAHAAEVIFAAVGKIQECVGHGRDQRPGQQVRRN